MSRCNKSRLRRRIGEQDALSITAKIPGVGKLSSKLLKQTLQAVAGGVVSYFSGVVLSYARDVLKTPLIEHAYSKDVALVRFQFKPEAAIRLAYTNDLGFGLRVVVYAEQHQFKSRVDHNSKGTELFHPPSHLSLVINDFISLAEADKYKVRIWERVEGCTAQATKVATVMGFKMYVLCELAFANEGRVMFRHADGG
jgi:hypothetical protein